MALWGGAINAQHTLSGDSLIVIRDEAISVSRYFMQDTGYVFNSCHNLPAEIAPEKVMALYQAAQEV